MKDTTVKAVGLVMIGVVLVSYIQFLKLVVKKA